MTTPLKSRILSPETMVPAGVLVTLLGPLLAGVWVAAITFSDMRYKLDELADASGRDNWNFQMQKDFTSDLRQSNPGIQTPDIYAIHARNLKPARQ